jgi:hypothetical protein
MGQRIKNFKNKRGILEECKLNTRFITCIIIASYKKKLSTYI